MGVRPAPWEPVKDGYPCLGCGAPKGGSWCYACGPNNATDGER